MRHWNVEPDSVLESPKLGDVLLVSPDGPEVNCVSGAIVSTVQVRLAGLESQAPKMSLARTSNVRDPWLSPEYETRLVYVKSFELQATQLDPSSRHSNCGNAVFAEAVNAALVELTEPLGPDVIVVSGSATANALSGPKESVAAMQSAKAAPVRLKLWQRTALATVALPFAFLPEAELMGSIRHVLVGLRR